MDVFFKTIGCAMVALMLCLTLTGIGKDYTLLLATLSCCMVAAVAMAYLDPVIIFFRDLEALIPLEEDLLEILLKAVGISVIGELAVRICVDSGNSALGKSVQLMTSVTILWISLPLLQALLDLVRQILEGI